MWRSRKYVKTRQESGDEDIPDDIANVIRKTEKAVSAKLENIVNA